MDGMTASRGREAPGYLPLTLLVGGVQMILTMDLVTMGILLPSIGRDFAAGPVMLSGLVSFSSLVFASMMLVGGRLADMIGQRGCIAAGLAIGAGGALVAGIAPHFALLVTGRLLFGLGAAIMIPANFSVINTVLPEGPARHRAYGIFGMVQGIALFLGPGLGGLLAGEFGWRSVFLATAAIMLLLLGASRMLVPHGAGEAARQRFDLTGALLFVPGIIALVLAISGGSGLLADAGARLALGAAGLALLGLFRRGQSRAASPLLPPDVLHRSGTVPGIIGMTAIMAASSALFLLPALVMQRAMGWTPAQSGMGMMPHAVAVILTGQMLGRIMGRYPLRRALLGAAILLIAGLALNGFMRPDRGYAMNVMAPMLLGAAGSIALLTVLMAMLAARQPAGRQGVISAAMFTSQQIGVSLGAVALLSVAASDPDPFTALNRAFLAAAAIALGGVLVLLRGMREKAAPPLTGVASPAP
ncbi:MFS family permease [Sphingobium jiangsuense]|uniref:MFS family permease n=1 Tax=Sphingobium jiangsuense TaxID=870476 RepID=A0A7W6BGM8_9SPHN|nr:MFS transporter [Sphingobium jiangsuense]MBB3925699.1 MFS family permease [Sphingobium jiangsuense]